MILNLVHISFDIPEGVAWGIATIASIVITNKVASILFGGD